MREKISAEDTMTVKRLLLINCLPLFQRFYSITFFYCRHAWNTAGDYVKFGFPLASAMTLLSWGGIDYKYGYIAAGQYRELLKAIKWGMDYLIKCHISKNELYGQVSHRTIDQLSPVFVPLDPVTCCLLSISSTH